MMEQLSLFGDFEPEKKDVQDTKQAPVTEATNPKSTSTFAPHHESIIDWVKEGYTVKQMCEILIKHKGFSGETYSQGTPKIYPQLMMYLTELEEQSVVKLAKVDPAGHGDFIDYDDQYVGRKCDAIFTMAEEGK
ncbi:DUF3895 domain-containing protein [Halalkalibacter alkalisediminis]|uniref:DUF3895 domain-containing protein n=1 Tax=Halalkalibacter alkalisediminis TaxID=935616 RepID=A0ABV6NJZ9_9BACI|nr:DUF3895 domain-containing protein [Halalkalibacter alkalisediminis]